MFHSFDLVDVFYSVYNMPARVRVFSEPYFPVYLFIVDSVPTRIRERIRLLAYFTQS